MKRSFHCIAFITALLLPALAAAAGNGEVKDKSTASRSEPIAGWNGYKFGESMESVQSRSGAKREDYCEIEKLKTERASNGLSCTWLSLYGSVVGGIKFNISFHFTPDSKLHRVELYPEVHTQEVYAGIVAALKSKYGKGEDSNSVDEAKEEKKCQQNLAAFETGSSKHWSDFTVSTKYLSWAASDEHGTVGAYFKALALCPNVPDEFDKQIRDFHRPVLLGVVYARRVNVNSNGF